MASRAIQSLLASRPEVARPHRIVVRVGAAAAWFAAVIYLAAGAVTGDESLIVEALGPILAASLMTIQVIVGREDAGLALFGSGLVVVIWYAAFGDVGTIVPAAVALVLICSLGMLFVVRDRLLVAANLAAALFAMPHLWQLTVDERIPLGAIMSVSFLITYVIFGSVQASSQAVNARYQMLFEESPAAMLEEDWSEAVAYIRSEYSGKPSRIRQFLLAYPAVVRRAVGQTKVLKANDAALRLMGVSNPARFLGYRNPDVVGDENIESFVSALVCLYEEGKSWEREIPFQKRSGELRWLHYKAVDTSTDRPGSSIFVGVADITHMRARQEAMAQMVRAKDEFIGSVSHELRTPLTAVVGITSEIAASTDMAEEERSQLLELVAGQAAEMANIVEDLLVAARAEIGTVSVETEPVDLAAELQATLDGLGASLVMPREETPAVLADPRRVRQILRNLVTNAVRHGGPNRRVLTGTLHDAVWLEVRDDGPGIPDEDAERIFDPYVTKGGKGSVGLGLSVARQLAMLMGGSLEYERAGGESVFCLQLPLVGAGDPVLASHCDVV